MVYFSVKQGGQALRVGGLNHIGIGVPCANTVDSNMQLYLSDSGRQWNISNKPFPNIDFSNNKFYYTILYDSSYLLPWVSLQKPLTQSVKQVSVAMPTDTSIGELTAYAVLKNSNTVLPVSLKYANYLPAEAASVVVLGMKDKRIYYAIIPVTFSDQLLIKDYTMGAIKPTDLKTKLIESLD
jgi:hypothetical protein